MNGVFLDSDILIELLRGRNLEVATQFGLLLERGVQGKDSFPVCATEMQVNRLSNRNRCGADPRLRFER